MSGKRSKAVDIGQVFEELEPRLLLSADPLAVFTDTGIAGLQAPMPETDDVAATVFQHESERADAAVRAELVVIDSRSPNFQQLYNDLIDARQQDRAFHIVVLDAHRDGIEQITEALSRYRDLDAMHIVSHGDRGFLALGNSRLDMTSLDERNADIERWKQAFTDSGDVFIYGCNLAATTEGRSFVDTLSRLTATDVAASDDLTGSDLHGGDWELEYTAGDVESRVAFSNGLQQAWTETLLVQTETVRDDFNAVSYAGNDGTAAWSGDWQETNDSGGAASGDIYIQGDSLVISEDESSPRSIHREADLSGATSATLSYLYKRSTPQTGGLITLDISANGGGSWTTLASYDLNEADAAFTAEAFDVSPFIAVDTQIRFSMSGADTTAYLEVDNLQIMYGDMANNDRYVVDEDAALVTQDNWYDSDWQFRRTLSFDNLDRTQNLDDFPVLVALDASRIDYGNTQNNGADLRFTDSDGSLLAHEVEHWDESGTSYVWVKVPRVDAASDSDHIWMYYGNPTAPDAQDAAAVWSNGYRAVYHLNESPGATGTVSDSSGNFDAVNAGSTDATGRIGNAQDFDGAGQYLDLGHDRYWISGSNTSTLSLWMSADTTSGAGDLLGVTVNGAPDTGASRISLNRSGDNIQMVARSMDDGSDVVTVNTTTSPLTVGQWHLVSGTVDYSSNTDNIRVYVDGVLVEAFSHDFTLDFLPDTSSTNAALGTDEDGGVPYFDGRLDEARVSNRLRSADWLSAQHASMTDAFITFSAEQSTAGVLGNDIDPQGDTLSVDTTPVTAPSNGALTLNTDGSFVYTPNADFNGSDYFVYEVTEGGTGNTAMASVLITVNPVEDAPLAKGDAFTLNEATTQLLDLAANDSDPDGDLDPESIAIVSAPSHGAINAINADGTVEYVHDGSEVASDSFSYTIRDIAGNLSAVVSVNLSINAVNDPAVIAGKDTGLVTEDDDPDADGSLQTSGTLTISDADAVGEEVFFGGTVSGVYGELTINMLGNWSYIADNSQLPVQSLADGAVLTDTMTIHSIDGTPHDVTITISGVNDAAVISGDDSGVLTEDDDPDADGLLETAGSLGITDIDAGEAAFAAGTTAGTYGSLSIDASGNWSYAADNSQAVLQGIADGATTTDTITVAAVDGTTRDIVITITGVNDPAVIAGDDAGTVTEDVDPDADGYLETAGALTLADADAGEAVFNPGVFNGTYGSLDIDAAGNWVYNADTSQAAVQQLTDAQTLLDTVTVTTADGTTRDVSITIVGVNDAAVISGDDSGVLTEDDDPDADGLLETAGSLGITDIDAGEAAFAAGTTAGTYGSLSIDASGNWSYAADNSQAVLQGIADGATTTDTITVAAVDGTTRDIVITITGVNDPAVIAGDDAGTVTEDVDPDADGYLETAGALTLADADAGEAVFNPGVFNGTYGSLDIDAAGNWVYNADTSQAAVQQLTDAQTLLDMVTVTTADGTTRDVSITIVGVNDAAVISGDDSGVLTEDDDPDADGLLETAGSLGITDIDAGEAAFAAGTTAGTYGSLSIDASGNWSYAADNSQAVLQGIADGATTTDTITVAAVDGTTRDIVITITGVNDPAVIAGDDAGTVTEDVDPDADGYLETAGALTLADADAGEAVFNPGVFNGTYGSLDIDAAGNWVYNADTSQAAVQQLTDAQTLLDTVTVTTADGTTRDVSITIVGVNDAAVISGDDSGVLTEDDDPDADGLLETAGSLGITDIDAGEAAFAAGTTAGTYGSLSIDASGNWSYAADNSQAVLQGIADGATTTDTITVAAVDGTTRDIVITITGVNDPAVIAGDDAGTVTEDVDPDADGYLETAGALTLADADAGEAVFNPGVFNGTYGSLDIDAAGNWVYNADTSQVAVQQLTDAQTLLDTVTVTTADGTTRDVSITIVGVNDAAVISGDDSGVLTEDDDPDADGLLETAGSLGITDIDAGEAAFAAGTTAGTYGSLSIDASGNWSYAADNSQAVLQGIADGATTTDTITVAAVDGTTRDIVITITGVNDPAVIAGDDAGTVTEDVDPDADGYLETAGALTLADADAGEAVFNPGVFNGTYGSLDIDAAGNWVYNADTSQVAVQQLTDAQTLLDTVTVTTADGTTRDVSITIVGVNDAPLAVGDTVLVAEGGSVMIDVVPNVSDVDSTIDLNSIVITGAPAHGTLTVHSDGTVTYDHDGGETVTDGFSYTTADVGGAISNAATVAITVNPINDAPAAAADVLIVNEGGSATVDLAANDADPDNPLDLASIVITAAPAAGSLVVHGDGTATYVHDGSESTGDSFSYTIADTTSAVSNAATVTIQVVAVNDSPVALGAGGLTVDEDAPDSMVDISGYFSDADDAGAALSYSITGAVDIGLFDYAGLDATTGMLSLDYAADRHGSSEITLRATDPAGQFAETLLTVTVLPVNDAPVIERNTGAGVTGGGVVSVSGDELLATDLEDTADRITYTLTAVPMNGILLLNGATLQVNDVFTQDDLDNDRVRYQSAAEATSDRFVFTVADSSGAQMPDRSFHIVVDFPVEAMPVGSEPTPAPPQAEDTGTPVTESRESSTVAFTENGPFDYQDTYVPFGGSATVTGPASPGAAVPVPALPQGVEAPESEPRVIVKEAETSAATSAAAPVVAVQQQSMRALWSAVDDMKQQMDQVSANRSGLELHVAAIETSGVALTAGFVAWVFRSGALMTSLLSTIPVWKGFDPLPILGYREDEEDTVATGNPAPAREKEPDKSQARPTTALDIESLFDRSLIRE